MRDTINENHRKRHSRICPWEINDSSASHDNFFYSIALSFVVIFCIFFTNMHALFQTLPSCFFHNFCTTQKYKKSSFGTKVQNLQVCVDPPVCRQWCACVPASLHPRLACEWFKCVNRTFKWMNGTSWMCLSPVWSPVIYLSE